MLINVETFHTAFFLALQDSFFNTGQLKRPHRAAAFWQRCRPKHIRLGETRRRHLYESCRETIKSEAKLECFLILYRACELKPQYSARVSNPISGVFLHVQVGPDT